MKMLPTSSGLKYLGEWHWLHCGSISQLMLMMIILMRMMTETTGRMFSRKGVTVIARDVIGRSKENINAVIHLRILTFFYREQELFYRGQVCSGLRTISAPQILHDVAMVSY
jgi:hypothetical protein